MSFRASGLAFSALSWGDPGERLALCLHGFPDTPWTWRYLGPHLAAHGWHVVAPFMRGYAPSDVAADGDYRVSALAQDAIEMHAALGGDDRAVLIGHDWGAAATYAVGAQSPKTFARHVTLAVPPVRAAALAALRARRLLARQLRCSWYMLFQQLPAVAERALPGLIPRLWRAWSPGYDAAFDVQHTLAALRDSEHRHAALAYYRALRRLGSLAGPDRKQHLAVAAPVREPMLYLHGGRDGCILPELARRAADTLPQGSRFESVPGVGHFLQLEQPDFVNATISAFVDHG